MHGRKPLHTVHARIPIIPVQSINGKNPCIVPFRNHECRHIVSPQPVKQIVQIGDRNRRSGGSHLLARVHVKNRDVCKVTVLQTFSNVSPHHIVRLPNGTPLVVTNDCRLTPNINNNIRIISQTNVLRGPTNNPL